MIAPPMSVPLSCMVILSDGGRAVPAISPVACKLAQSMAKGILRGWVTEEQAVEGVIEVARREHHFASDHNIPHPCQFAVIDHYRAWVEAERRVLDQISRAVWPLALARAPGQTIFDTAHKINRAHQLPLTRSDVVAECRRIAVAATAPRAHVRGR